MLQYATAWRLAHVPVERGAGHARWTIADTRGDLVDPEIGAARARLSRRPCAMRAALHWRNADCARGTIEKRRARKRGRLRPATYVAGGKVRDQVELIPRSLGLRPDLNRGGRHAAHRNTYARRLLSERGPPTGVVVQLLCDPFGRNLGPPLALSTRSEPV